MSNDKSLSSKDKERLEEVKEILSKAIDKEDIHSKGNKSNNIGE